MYIYIYVIHIYNILYNVIVMITIVIRRPGSAGLRLRRLPRQCGPHSGGGERSPCIYIYIYMYIYLYIYIYIP